jgi:signal peptidase II
MRPSLFYTLAGVILVADQVTKWAVIQNLPVHASRPVLGSILSFTHTQNRGGAFSLFNAPPAVFVVVAILAVSTMVYVYHRTARQDLRTSAALSLACGGALGNLIDRARLGYVIDFFDVHFWPIFNIADSAITLGIVLLLLGHLPLGRRARLPANDPTSTAGEPS